ncbi:MAG: hypothetical protein LUD50_02970 [Clostridia bacterium]|nr:hypothetical protein [Clostridia bacterium]
MMSYAGMIWAAAIAAAVIAVLVALTNIFSQVIKKVVDRTEFPTQAIVFVIAEVLTLVSAGILDAVLSMHPPWCYWVLAVIMGVLVAYGAMFGYDNLYKQLKTAVKSLISCIFNRADDKEE